MPWRSSEFGVGGLLGGEISVDVGDEVLNETLAGQTLVRRSEGREGQKE
jgi:hypothetical protein